MDFTETWEDTIGRVSQAVRSGNFKVFKKLLKDKAPIDVRDNRGWQAIHEACVLSATDPQPFLVELLNHEDCDPNCRSFEGETPLLLVCKYQKNEDYALKAVKLLLRHNADPNLCDDEEETPLFMAVKNKLKSVFDYLMTQYEESQLVLNVDKGDFGGWTPLHEAVTQGNCEIVSRLLMLGTGEGYIGRGAKLGTQDECGMTPIFAAAQAGKYDTLKILVEEAKRRNEAYLLDEPANDGATPLMIASQVGATDCIKLLIDSGADPNRYANDGVNAIHLAAECGHEESLDLLMKHLDVRSMQEKIHPHLEVLKTRNPVHLAIQSEKMGTLKVLLRNNFPVDSVDYIFEQKFSLSLPSPKYVTGLGLAVTLNLYSFAETLLHEFRASPNSVHPTVYSPLHCAFSVIDSISEVEPDDINSMLKLLLEAGADPNWCRQPNEPNELLHAIFKPEAFLVLLEYGLDTAIFFKEGFISRFLAMSLHLLDYNWYQNVLVSVVSLLERNPVTRNYFAALNQHIDSHYKRQFGLQEYKPEVWIPIMRMFDTPHKLKESCRFFIRRRVYETWRQTLRDKTPAQEAPSFPSLIQTLEIPVTLQNYLLFK